MKKGKFLYLILIAVLGFSILLGIVNHMQTKLTLENQVENSKVKLEIAENRIEDNKVEESKDWESYDSFMIAKADAIALVIDTKGEQARTTDYLNTLANTWGLEGLYICSDQIISAGSVNLSEHTIEKLKSSDTFDTEKDLGICFYASHLNDGTMIIIAQDSKQMLSNEEYLISISNALSTIKVGSTGYIVAYDLDNKNGSLSVAYSPKESAFAENKVVEDVSKLPGDYSDYFRADKKSYFVTVKDIDNYRLLAVVPKSEIKHFVNRTVKVASVVFGSVLIVLLFYSMFLSSDIQKRVINRDDLKGKFKLITCVGLSFIFVATCYTWTLSALSDSMGKLSDKLDSVEYIISQNDEKTKSITSNYEQEYIDRASRIAHTLKECPELLTEGGLQELASRAKLQSIYVFNANGEVEATNTVFSDFRLSTDEGDQSFEFWNIINGYDDYIVQEATKDDTVKHNLVQYIGVKRLDSPGMVQIGISPKRLEERLFGDSLEAVLDNIAVEDKGFIYSESKDTIKHTMPVGFTKYENKTYIYSSRKINDKNIVVCKPIYHILSEGIHVSIIITILSAIFFLIMIIALSKTSISIHLEDENTDNNETAASRFSTISTPWKNMSAEGKISRILFIVMSLVALLVIVYVNKRGGEDNNIISFIMSREWKKEISIFSLSYILDISIEVLFLTAIIRRIILSFSVGYGARAETVGRLFNSIIKYVSVIGIVFFGLYCIGIDVKTLLASAGLLTLGISLGAQSLVGDILAGVFIVFEGDFRVGDIVTIGDFRGTVKEIGIRTTKVENIGNDLKIFRNSSISDIVNMTKKYSFAAARCGIEYGESIEHVESILKKELPKIKDKLPAIVDGPFYKGVVELGDSSVVILIVAQCHESDRIQLERDLNRQVKLIFDNNKIGIPFPQIVMHQPETKKHATKKEKQDAETFVNEQKEKSKGIVGIEDN